MASKRNENKTLQSMREFERMYYPNNLGSNESKLSNYDPSIGKKFADETFAQIKKKYRINC